MMSFPDFKQKKVLLVQAEYGTKCKLQLINDNVCFYKNSERVNQVSAHLVFAIFLVGELSITTALIKKVNKLGISIFFLNANFSSKASIPVFGAGNYLLRLKQYGDIDNFSISKKIILNKIQNQELILKKVGASYDQESFSKLLKKVDKALDQKILLGIEGNASKIYFQAIFESIGWYRRSPRTKEDITNLLLDIGYTYLFNYCDALLSLFGFDTYKGVYHQLFFQRKSLVCDIIEPMRFLIDKQILKSYNLKQIKKEDCIYRSGAFEFKEGFKSSKKYTAIFFELISDHSDDIYSYVHEYYRYCMNSEKYTFPVFKV